MLERGVCVHHGSLRSFRLCQLSAAFANCVAEHAMPVRRSGFPTELSSITAVVPPISARMGAPEYPKFVRHLWLNDRLSGLSLTEQSRTMEGRYSRSIPYPICIVEAGLTTRSSSRVVGLTGIGFVEIASLSTITAQSLITLSCVGGPGENSFGTTSRFASACTAGTPLFIQLKI